MKDIIGFQMKYFPKFLVGLLMAVLLLGESCQNLKNSQKLEKCSFKINSVRQIAFSGIDVTNKRSLKDFEVSEGLTLANEIKNERLTTDLVLELSVKNPNTEAVTVREIQYVLVFDGKEILNEENKSDLKIPANSSKSFSVSFRFDLLDIVKNTAYETILKTALSLIDEKKQPDALDLYIRPDIRSEERKIKYQGFIKMTNAYRAESQK